MKSRNVLPIVEADASGKFHCPDCERDWPTLKAMQTHWARKHSNIMPQRSKGKTKKSYYNPKVAAAYYQKKKRKRLEAEGKLPKSKPTKSHHTKPRPIEAPILEACPVCHTPVRNECAVCHTPFGPIIEGIMKALEERLKNHAKKS